jgi:plasmid replication initiation protein
MPKHDLASMEHPIFSLSTRPDRRILSYQHNDAEITVTPSVKGRATIFDADILIFCISQLMAALNAGRPTSRTLTLTAHDLLRATQRETSGDSYRRLRDAFERLAGTRITTNITTGPRDSPTETTTGFGLIESWEIVRKTRAGRMVSVSVTLSDWLYRAVLSKSVLTLNRAYFSLRKPLERRLYELARKHCGRQPAWTVSVATLHKKSGSAAPVRVFRAAIRRMIDQAHLPDYTMSEEQGDLIRFTRQARPTGQGALPLTPDTLEAARALAPGHDVYALQAEWQTWWEATGRPRLSSPDRAFLGWVAKRRR